MGLRHKVISLVLLATVCLQCLSVTAYAQTLDASRLEGDDFSIRLHYNLPLRVDKEGIAFHLYHVAELSENVQFKLLDSLQDYNKEYNIKFQASSPDEWLQLASYLYATLQNRVEPDRIAETDSAGYVNFLNLTQGLYLVVGEKVENSAGIVYTPTPFFAYVPCRQNDGSWVKEYFAEIKYTAEEQGETSRRVLKVWDDAGHSNSRPAQVTVELRKDGVTYDTLILSKENNWRGMWEGLDNRHTWSIVEVEGSAGYQVSVETQGITTVITNTVRNSTEPPAPEEPPDKPPGVEPPPQNVTPEDPPSSDTPDADTPTTEIPDQDVPLSDFPQFEEITDPRNPSYIPDDVDIPDDNVPLSKLPQTGQLWWPVLPLLVSGVVILISGIILRRCKSDEDD